MTGGQCIIRSIPQVKICGLTRPDEAVGCADLGADAIGLVFFPKSPRHVSIDRAAAVVDALSETVAAVGVFVNEKFSFIMARVDRCRLSMVQLHGQESPDLVDRLKTHGVRVIKALFVDGSPELADVGNYPADAFLVECANGPLPGGNALVWDWGAARDLGRTYPLVLSGGLSPDNAASAIAAGMPAALDVSSGVEASPGRKNMDKVAQFFTVVRSTARQPDEGLIPTVFRAR
jgi:phosphoribosylanthranilate isomerase